MAWIFALGIISLMVWHPGFRKVMLWIGGAAFVLAMIAIVAATLSERPIEPRAIAAAPNPCEHAADKRSCFFDPDAEAVMASFDHPKTKIH